MRNLHSIVGLQRFLDICLRLRCYRCAALSGGYTNLVCLPQARQLERVGLHRRIGALVHEDGLEFYLPALFCDTTQEVLQGGTPNHGCDCLFQRLCYPTLCEDCPEAAICLRCVDHRFDRRQRELPLVPRHSYSPVCRRVARAARAKTSGYFDPPELPD